MNGGRTLDLDIPRRAECLLLHSEIEAEDKAEVEEESDPRGAERKEPDGREDENNRVDVQSEDAVLGYNSFSFKSTTNEVFISFKSDFGGG